MRYQQITGKEIINAYTGARLGILGQTDLQIDKKNGEIKSLIIPSYKWFGLKKEENELTIPWKSVKKIGEDIILIEFIE